MVLLGAATALGLWLGPKVGLGAPLLYRLVSGDRKARSHLRALLVPCAALGVLVGVAPPCSTSGCSRRGWPRPAVTPCDLQPPAWQGLLASFYGAIAGELLLRLGLMTLLVWAGARLTRTSVPPPLVMWAAIVITALLFGAGHLPTTAAFLPLTPLVIARALLLNGMAGIVFGWLYWKRGLLAAMLAHFSADVVLHVVAPLLIHRPCAAAFGRASPTSARAGRQH